jgi:hypothetical protein
MESTRDRGEGEPNVAAEEPKEDEDMNEERKGRFPRGILFGDDTNGGTENADTSGTESKHLRGSVKES